MPLNPSDDDRAQVETAFRNLMILREGQVNHVYADSRGLPTVGIGHLVVADDHLALGDQISAARVDELFHADAAAALTAAWNQAGQAGITSLAFIPALASVNFQLGTGWTGKFPNTWAMIVNGKYVDAAHALEGTIWQKQTPVRVADLQHALLALPPKPV
jgi:GH24 family phage-related lysozyme (muramidase)